MNKEEQALVSAVEAANTQFYQALQACDIKAMEEVWLHESWVRCIHPSSDLIVGWEEIRQSWAQIFNHTTSLKLSISNLFIKMMGEVAWVEGRENIATFFERGFTSGQAQATNLYIQTSQGWLMIHHHASSLPIDVHEDWSDEDILQ
jgi:ketosteroid isomerase-like protein